MKLNKTKIITLCLLIALASGLTYFFLKSKKSSEEKLITSIEKDLTKEETSSIELKRESTQHIDTVSFFEKRDKNHKNRQRKLISKNLPKIQGVKYYESSNIDKFYKETYSLPEQVERTEKGICLSDTVAKRSIRDILEGRLASSLVESMKLQLRDKDSLSEQLRKSNEKLDSSLTKLNNSLDKCKELNKIYSKRRVNRWGIGPTLNYSLPLQKESSSQVSVGVGISYSIFRF